MKRFVPFGFALGLLASAFGACTMDFDQFQPGEGTGGTGGAGGAGGACATECCAPSDCPTPAEPCMQATCTAGSCGEEVIADGTEASTQTPGDCQVVVCQGGAPESVPDDTDTPGAANDCVSGLCADGMPTSEPLAAGTACTSDGGTVCDGDGACVGCLSDGDCPEATPNCDTNAHVCVGADCMDGDQNGGETDTDCGGPDCAPCQFGDGCLVGTDCESGVCGADMTCDKNPLGAPCADANDCQSDECFDGVCCATTCFGPCNRCDTAGMEGQCVDLPAGSNPNNACSGTEVCDGDGGCAEPDGKGCGNDGDCVSGNCEQGVCCATACTADCKSCNVAGSEGTCSNVPAGQDPGNDCPGATICDGAGMCMKAPIGAMCAAAAECTSDFCVDGRCCNEVCDGTCEACNLAGALGTCTPVADGQDPDGECPGTQVCDGAGMCKMP